MRYVTAAFIPDHHTTVDRVAHDSAVTTIQVIDQDPLRRNTGLVDKRGVAIFAVQDDLVVGFVPLK